ncbi:MAG TPA: anti-sigma factor [Thermoanaerobaculia bacterium]|nr:anti-sigma factor [Thermoanaerobaculia bacterium]
MPCSEGPATLGAWLDGELEADRRAEFAAHLATCETCAARQRVYGRLGAALRDPALVHVAPGGLVRSVAFSRRRTPRRSAVGRWAFPLAAGLLLGVAVAGYRERSVRADALAAELAGSHVRALQAEKLTDVPSSDRHTVKPWFAGKLDFSPPVPDLSVEGFPIVGGRLDAVAGRPAAALVYSRRRHVIDVYVRPAEGAPKAISRDWNGFHFAGWREGDLAFWAVSDLDRRELDRFVTLFRSRAS